MEVSLASTCIMPLNFNSNKTPLLKHNHNNNFFHSQIPTFKLPTKPLSIVNASMKPTLSSNWLVSDDLSAKTSSPWLPKFEELDTTNMLLRQRIVFLGSQVINFFPFLFGLGFIAVVLIFQEYPFVFF
jgi:ATP-dependent Clp protease protease subunit